MEYIRANNLNRITHDAPAPRVGIIAAGKAVPGRAAGDRANSASTRRVATALGLRLAKVGAVWPLDPGFVRAFAAGLDTILVVEEKRALIENQMKSALLRRAARAQAAHRRQVRRRERVGSRARRRACCRAWASLRHRRSRRRWSTACSRSRPIAGLQPVGSAAPRPWRRAGADPRAGFCSGCPHNRSTRSRKARARWPASAATRSR